jgi:hypothetical protein
MPAWTSEELERIGAAEELQLASLRPDGSLGDPVTIWVVRDGDDLYVRSWRADEGRWYRSARRRGKGRVGAGGLAKEVAFVPVEEEAVNEAVDTAYRSKYERYGADYVGPMTRPEARATKLRLTPRATNAAT